MSAVRELAQELPCRLEWPKGSAITIQAVPNRHGGQSFGCSYRVTVPARYSGKSTQRRQYAKMEDAKRWAEDAVSGWRQQGRDFFKLTDQERHDFSSRHPKLRERDISVGAALDFALRQIGVWVFFIFVIRTRCRGQAPLPQVQIFDAC
jgi:hypothetical protein